MPRRNSDPCSIFSGAGLIRRSVGGLMDRAEPHIQKLLTGILATETARYGIEFHGLRHRNLGVAHRVEVHLLFPEQTPVGEAHRIATAVEDKITAALEPGSQVVTHLEAIEDHQKIHGQPD